MSRQVSNFGWFKVSQIDITTENTELNVSDPRSGNYWALELPKELIQFSGNYLLTHQEIDAHLKLYDLLLAQL